MLFLFGLLSLGYFDNLDSFNSYLSKYHKHDLKLLKMSTATNGDHAAEKPAAPAVKPAQTAEARGQFTHDEVEFAAALKQRAPGATLVLFAKHDKTWSNFFRKRYCYSYTLNIH